MWMVSTHDETLEQKSDTKINKTKRKITDKTIKRHKKAYKLNDNEKKPER